MNSNPIRKPQPNFNPLQDLSPSEELSPLTRKNLLKTKHSLSPKPKHFNPHLERLKTNYYLKDNTILPYSYTASQNSSSQPSHQNPSMNTLQIHKNHKNHNSRSKILSLKQFSYIQTVSQISGKSNDSQNSQLDLSRTFKPNQINSEISSPLEFQNFPSTFTTPDLQNSQPNFIKSHEIPKITPRPSQTNSISIKNNKLKIIQNQSQNDQKTNKIPLKKKNKTLKLSISKRVIQIKISPIKRTLNFSNSIDVHESSVIFDYNKFYHKKTTSPLRKQNSSSHPINQKIFKFFGEEIQKQNTLKISNQNDSFIDIVKQINSPTHKSIFYQGEFVNKLNQVNRSQWQTTQKDKLFSSDLTCLVKEGPRSYSVGNQLRKLSGHKNNFTQSKRESIVLKTQTRPTSGRSQILNQLQLYTPTKENSHKNQHETTNSNRIFLKTQNFQFRKYFADQADISPLKYGNSAQIFSEKSNQLSQKPSVQLKSGSKDSKRRTGKGISVISKQKKGDSSQLHGNQRQGQNKVMASKLKSLNEIKNMKKLSLASPKKIEVCQVGSPIRYKKH